MSTGNFYTPEEIKPLYGELVAAYQVAFAGPPWNEVSKCADERSRCVGGLSTLAVGTLCNACELRPSRPAYEAGELLTRFNTLGSSRPTAWYAEQNELGLTMAALAWKALPSDIAVEKYSDVPEMNDWIVDTLGNTPILWLDEVFANRQLKPEGNLQNFGKFVTGLATRLDCGSIAYRTKVSQMTAAPKRDFGDNAVVLTREKDVPDRRDFVILNNVREATL